MKLPAAMTHSQANLALGIQDYDTALRGEGKIVKQA